MKLKKIKKQRAKSAKHKFQWKGFKHHPFVIPIATLLFLFFVSVGAYIGFSGKTFNSSDSHVIILSYDNKHQTIPTSSETVGEFFKRANITINEGDRVEPSIDTPIIDDKLRVNIYRARPVQIIDGNHKIQGLSAATTPRSVAEQAGVTVYPEDEITSKPTENFLRDGIGEQVEIDRATPTNLNLYGTPIMIRTHAKTVGDVLKEKQVKLSEGDTVQPSPNTPVTANAQIFVLRTGTQITTQQEDIAMPVQYVEDSSLTLGTTAIRQQGTPGKKVVTYQLDLQNGKEVGRHIIQEVIQSQAVAQIVARGRAVDVPADKEAVMSAAGISSGDYGYVNYIVSRESGWCPTKLQGQHTCPPYAPGSYPAGVGYGLVQATPGGKMASAGSDWETNSVTQLRWATGYAVGRYGSWSGAYDHWASYHNW